LQAIVQRAMDWEATDAQTLWILLGAELSSRPTHQVERGLDLIVTQLRAAFDSQPRSIHWEVLHSCLQILSSLAPTPYLVYLLSEIFILVQQLQGPLRVGHGNGHVAKAPVACLSRWARSWEADLRCALGHLLRLEPVGDGHVHPDVSHLVLLLHWWVGTVGQAPAALIATLVELNEDSALLSALRQEMSLCEDASTRALESVLSHVPPSAGAGVSSSGSADKAQNKAQKGVEKRSTPNTPLSQDPTPTGTAQSSKRGRADEVSEASATSATSTSKRPRRGSN